MNASTDLDLCCLSTASEIALPTEPADGEERRLCPFRRSGTKPLNRRKSLQSVLANDVLLDLSREAVKC